jgi:hypothetical protein
MIKRRKFLQTASLIAAGASAFGYQVSYSKNRIIPMDNPSNKGMLQHNVFFYLKEGVNDKEKKSFEKGLKKFLSSVDQVAKFEIGIPAETEDRDVVDNSYDYALFAWFESIKKHDKYQKDKQHKKFINDFSSLWKEVKVYDAELL